MFADRPVSPLLEFDASREAYIEPGLRPAGGDVPEACVVTFFGDTVERLLDDGARVLAENRWEDGPHRLHAGVGAPLAGGLLEETIAAGCRAYVVCGGAGALRQDLALGHLIVVESAVRDEGTSHH